MAEHDTDRPTSTPEEAPTPDRRRRRGRAAVAVLVVVALGSSFAAGVVWSGGGPPATPGEARTGVSSDPIRLTGSGRLLPPTADCDELLAIYHARGVEAVGPWGWGDEWGHAVLLRGAARDGSQRVFSDLSGSAAPEAAAAEAPRMSAAHSSGTGTNVQERGVDEPDHVKTDGERLFRIADARLTAYDLTGDAPRELGSLAIPEIRDGEILLVEDRVVVVAPERAGRWEPRQRTRVVGVDVADPAAMSITDTQVWDAGLVTARLHGTSVRVVAAAGLPDLDFVQPRRWRGERRALERNRRLVEQTTIDDWLPQATTFPGDGQRGEGEATRLLECSEVSVPDSETGLGTLAVVGFDVASPAERDATGLLTASDLAYFSTTRMYVATGAQFWGGCCWEMWDAAPRRPGVVSVPGDAATQGRTEVHAFALTGTATTHTASGEVDGHLKDRWSMDEFEGVLRLAVGESSRTGNFNSVVTLRERDGRLVEVGRVDKLGVNEDIKSMRWFDELAVMVTFRQIDPLYAIDLRDPESPELLGELKIPGFTEYLHPVGPRRLIGIGQDASMRGVTRGAQAAVFDLVDMSSPEQTSLVKYRPRSVAGAATDPRQFTWLPDRRTALTVISRGWRGRTGWVSVLELRRGELRNRMIEVEYGSDIDTVRMVPLPPTGDGAGSRVVLVTGSGVSFLPL